MLEADIAGILAGNSSDIMFIDFQWGGSATMTFECGTADILDFTKPWDICIDVIGLPDIPGDNYQNSLCSLVANATWLHSADGIQQASTAHVGEELQHCCLNLFVM